LFKHLLVTLDGSPRSETVIPHATAIARSMSAELTLIRIVDAVSSDWSERGALGKNNSNTAGSSVFLDQAQAYLERIAALVRADGAVVHTIVKQGTAARQIVAAAKEVDADAIAMATHSRRGVSRLMFGSVAEAVLHDTQLPVLLVRAA
jgi:nucleotide-binding universal stress UspA family protein